jgi:hypothetical protein
MVCRARRKRLGNGRTGGKRRLALQSTFDWRDDPLRASARYVWKTLSADRGARTPHIIADHKLAAALIDNPDSEAWLAYVNARQDHRGERLVLTPRNHDWVMLRPYKTVVADKDRPDLPISCAIFKRVVSLVAFQAPRTLGERHFALKIGYVSNLIRLRQFVGTSAQKKAD